MQRILLITDSPKTVTPWQHELVRMGYPVSTCGAESGLLLEALRPRPPEVCVLDGTGLRLSPKALRELIKNEFPAHECGLIWLVGDEQVGKMDPSAGMDDFIILPAGVNELIARIRLLLWKSRRVDAADLIVAGDLVIDQANYTVSVGNNQLELTFKEYELLRFLASHRGRVFTREALLNQVWGYDYFGGTRTVDVHVRRIRAKLGLENEDMVETVRNVGYRFNDNF